MIFKIWKLLLVGNCLTFGPFALVYKKWEIKAVEKMQPKLWRFFSILRKSAFWFSIKHVFQTWKCHGNIKLDGKTLKNIYGASVWDLDLNFESIYWDFVEERVKKHHVQIFKKSGLKAIFKTFIFGFFIDFSVTSTI